MVIKQESLVNPVRHLRPFSERDIVQLDWLVGLAVSARGLEWQAAFTPLMRCLGIGSNGDVRCESTVPIRTGQFHSNLRLSSIARMELGKRFWLEQGFRDVARYGGRHVRRSRLEIEASTKTIQIRDDNERLLLFDDLLREYPTIAEKINDYASCPPTTAFYVLADKGKVVVIPTSEILRECYMPSASYLCDYLTSPERPARFFDESNALFNGLSYVEHHLGVTHVVPVRAQRYIARAEHEISQLLPRACAASRGLGRAFPILIRPPFAGRVRLYGHALSVKDHGREYNAYVSKVRFSNVTIPLGSPENNHYPRLLPFHFSPRLSRFGAFLMEINASSSEPMARSKVSLDISHLPDWRPDRWEELLYPDIARRRREEREKTGPVHPGRYLGL